MTSLEFTEIFSLFYVKAEAYDLLSLTESETSETLSLWLKSASSKPYVRRLFKTFTLDAEFEELSFEMKYTIDEDTDISFVEDIVSLGMLVEWLRPKINTITNIAQMFGSKEEKFYSQSNHISSLQNIKNSIEKEQRCLIRDRGTFWNSYLDGAQS